ncbi:hypothetical protein KSS87_013394 [Heliosperma pusillum]|nr:hypothetical protein KSS87_013394 [Heliosperma pusillum]
MKEHSHKELHCKKWETKQGRLIVHTRSYNANNGKCRKTHTRSYIAKKWEMKQGRLIVHTRCNNANNG